MLSVGDLTLDPATREVRRGDEEIPLSAKEFALLETFMRRPGEVLSRLHLLEHAWDFAYDARSNVVDVYIRHLRRKIDEPFGRSSLETVRGAGYRLTARGVSGVPIRVRVTAAFAVVMALVLAASGWFLYSRLASHLSHAARAGAPGARAGPERARPRIRAPRSPRTRARRLVEQRRELRAAGRRAAASWMRRRRSGGSPVLSDEQLRPRRAGRRTPTSRRCPA